MEPALAKVNGTTYPTAQGMIDEAFAKEEVWITASYQVRTAGRACHTAVPPHGLETHSRCQVVAAITHATVSVRGSSTLGEVPALGSDHWDRLHCLVGTAEAAPGRLGNPPGQSVPRMRATCCTDCSGTVRAKCCQVTFAGRQVSLGKWPNRAGSFPLSTIRPFSVIESTPAKAARCVSRHELPFQVASPTNAPTYSLLPPRTLRHNTAPAPPD
jgi:hypothetical protein